MDLNNSTSSYHFEAVVTKARNAFISGKTRSLQFRLDQLRRLLTMLQLHRDDLESAVTRDFRKNTLEVGFYEFDILENNLRHMIANLKDYVKPEKQPFNLLAPTDEASVSRIPYGVVLVLGTWNLPLVLSLHPFFGAIAGGNAAILKPSEVAHNTASVIAKLLPQYLDSECYHVIQAEVEETKQLLLCKFDFIFCTGSTSVGKYILRAAAEHLTPVTLELGGKSPCYIDDSIDDVDLVVKKILWGKLINVGQLCVAPDYILCSKKMEAEIVRAVNFVMMDFYGRDGDLQRNPNLGRIINDRHCLRLKRLLDNTRGKIVYGGKVDLEDLWVHPTVVANVPMDDVLMEEEIFGPILPIVTANYLEHAIDYINSKPNPLCVYVFSKNSKVSDRLLGSCSSGTASVNDVAFHCIWQGLPFGGIGDSGMGQTGQGKFGFEAFTYKRSNLKRSLSPLADRMSEFRYPPYSKLKNKFASCAYRYFLKFNINTSRLLVILTSFFFGVLITFILQS